MVAAVFQRSGLERILGLRARPHQVGPGELRWRAIWWEAGAHCCWTLAVALLRSACLAEEGGEGAWRACGRVSVCLFLVTS